MYLYPKHNDTLKRFFLHNHWEKNHYEPLCHTELKQDQIYSKKKTMEMNPVSQYKDEKKESI